jgi:serine kinase
MSDEMKAAESTFKRVIAQVLDIPKPQQLFTSGGYNNASPGRVVTPTTRPATSTRPPALRLYAPEYRRAANGQQGVPQDRGDGNTGVTSRNMATQTTTHYTHFLLKLGYRMGPTIGSGSYSKVKVADMIDLKSGQFLTKVACKMIDTRKASKSYATKFLPRELAIIRSIKHQNLVRVKQIVDLGPLVCVFMEYASLGDLLDYVQQKGAIDDFEARSMFRQIAMALMYLHGRGIAHRDLKCENVLRFADGVVKLTDFGFACGFLDPSSGTPVLSRTYCGSMAYAAPEILQAQPYNPTKYDMWSVGCILYIMVTGKMPFSDRSTGQQLQQQMGHCICFPRGPHVITFACKKLIRDLLNPRPAERPSAEDALMSTWIKYSSMARAVAGATAGTPPHDRARQDFYVTAPPPPMMTRHLPPNIQNRQQQ